MRDGTGVAKVVDAYKPALGHDQAEGQELSEHRHRIRHVHDLGVVQDLSDEVARAEIIADGHANAQRAGVGVCAEHVLYHGLGVAVVGAVEVGPVLLSEASTT